MKYTFLIAFALIMISCNSKEKKYSAAHTKNQDALAKSIERGKDVYDDLCISCHMANGEGVPKVFPPLANSDYLQSNQTESIIAIKYGMSGEVTVNGIKYNSLMTALGLSDEEVADVMNYINNSWGNKIDNFVTTKEVSKIKP